MLSDLDLFKANNYSTIFIDKVTDVAEYPGLIKAICCISLSQLDDISYSSYRNRLVGAGQSKAIRINWIE